DPLTAAMGADVEETIQRADLFDPDLTRRFPGTATCAARTCIFGLPVAFGIALVGAGWPQEPEVGMIAGIEPAAGVAPPARRAVSAGRLAQPRSRQFDRQSRLADARRTGQQQG